MLPLRHDMRKIHRLSPKSYHPKKSHGGNHIHVSSVCMHLRPQIQLLVFCTITISLPLGVMVSNAVLIVDSGTLFLVGTVCQAGKACLDCKIEKNVEPFFCWHLYSFVVFCRNDSTLVMVLAGAAISSNS